MVSNLDLSLGSFIDDLPLRYARAAGSACGPSRHAAMSVNWNLHCVQM